jgi:Ca-activated chloride channel family protein
VNEGLGWSYMFAHPETLAVALRHPSALLLLGLAPLLGLLRPAGSRHQRWALAARVTAFTLLVVTLAGLGVSVCLPSDRMSLIAVVDRSESIDGDGRNWEQRYLDRVATALAPGDELGVVAFGADTKVVRPPGPAGRIDLDSVAVSETATDIGKALETSLALLPPGAEHRVLLISDGNETRGSGVATVERARRAAVTIFAVVPPHAGGADVAVEKLAVPALVAQGSVFPVRVIVRNHGKPRPAILSLSADGDLLGNEPLTLQTGLNAVEIPYRMNGPGSHRLQARVSATDDVIAGNNAREATVMVGGKSRVLLVTTRARSSLARVLARKDISVTTIPPQEFPVHVEGLLGFHAAIFEDVRASGFGAARLETLERYVRDFGGGLMVIAGDATFGDTGFKKTPVERLLPVTLEPRRPPRAQREPLALFILIDRSNSMGYHIRNRLERSEVESKLVYAKRAALAVVTQLKDTDLAGVIAFDSRPFEVSPLRPLRDNRTLLEADIPRLQPGGGTDFFDALESARQQLVDSRTTARHVILLTDGDTNRGAADHYPLIAALARAQISVTTVRIGEDTVNLTLLNDISNRTGGQFYHVEHVETLPELLLKDTSNALEQVPRHGQTFAPRLAGVSQALRGVKQKELPNLNGYAYTRLKPGADLLLYILAQDKKDPLLAAWQYGLGRVVAFTASLDDDAEAWIGWEAFGKVWSQLVHWAVREQTPWDYTLDVHRAEGQTTLTVHSFTDVDDGLLMARLFANPDRPFDVTLVPRTPRDFTGRLPALAGGRYPLTITKRSGKGEASQRTEFLSVPDRDEAPQEELDADHPNLTLLKALTAGTGGAIDAPLRTVVGRQPGTRRVDHPLDWLLIPAAMGLFLTDVGLRRLGTRTTGR